MRLDQGTNASRDMLSNWLIAGPVFWLPAVVLLVSGFLDMSQGWRTGVWMAALSTMGIACVINARRCGRVHCYATGPFFLIMAILALLYGSGVVSLGKHGWNVIGAIVLVGALLLCCLPEALIGKYRRKNEL